MTGVRERIGDRFAVRRYFTSANVVTFSLQNKDGGCNGDYSAAASVYSADTTLTSLDSADSGDTYVSSRVYASPPPLCAVQEEEMNAGGDDDMDQRLTEPAEVDAGYCRQH